MRARRRLLVLSLPMALALSACTGSGTPAPSTGIDVGTAASSQSPATSSGTGTTPEDASQPRLTWGSGQEATWGEAVTPVTSMSTPVGKAAPVLAKAQPVGWGFLEGKVLSSQNAVDSFDAATNSFSQHPTVAWGDRAVGTSRGLSDALPGQVIAMAATKDAVVWAEATSADVAASSWRIYRSEPDGSDVTPLFASFDVGDEPFASTRMVVAGGKAFFLIGLEASRQLVAVSLDGSQQDLVPAGGATDVWLAGGEAEVLWDRLQGDEIQIVKSPAARPHEAAVVLAAKAEEAAPLRLLAASGTHALIGTADRLAVVDLEAKGLRQVAGFTPARLEEGTAGAGGGRSAIRVDAGFADGSSALSVAPDGEVELLTLPATEGGLAVDANRIAVTSTDKQLTVVAVD